jgi:hypothetical protein
MKNTIRLIGTLSRWLCAITFVVIIGLTLTATGCDNGTTGGGGGSGGNNNDGALWDELIKGVPPTHI